MELSNQVVSFKQAKKLVELGFIVNSLFWYDSTGKLFYSPDVDYSEIPEDGFYPALTVAELGVLLGMFLSMHFIDIGPSDDGFSFSPPNESPINFKTEAQARAEALIWLLKNKYLKPEDLKL